MKNKQLTDLEISVIREKARQKRYKKPIHSTFNLDSIRENLYEMQNECQDVSWFFEGGDENLLEELIGGEDEVREFKFMFSGLEFDIERMQEDLENEWIPDFFDIFFPAVSDNSSDLLGFDEYVEDYMGISIDFTKWAIEEARTKMKRFTKDQLFEGATVCFRIALCYLAIQNRYEDLRASMDIIRGQNKAELEVLKSINELYERADEASEHFRYKYNAEVRKYEKFISGIDPYSQLWIG